MLIRNVILGGFLALLVPLSGQQTPATPSCPGGRYQIVTGEYIAVSEGRGFAEKGVFKLDTETGQAWVFQSGLSSDGKLFKRWVAVGN